MLRRLRVGTAAALVLSACVGPGGDRNSETADAAWLAEAQREIAAREYRASENGEGFQAPNRAHNLRTYFEPTGIRVHDRTASGSPELLQLTLTGMGRGQTLAAVERGTGPVTAENRVEIHRPGLVEWYVNSPAGLEQGFTLAKRQHGEGPLVVELAVAGARPALLGDAVIFDTAQRKLRYGELVANDAEGTVLPSHLELASTDQLRIVVDDAAAAYPIVIDPLLTETADTQLESNQASADFGVSVAAAGDVNGDGHADVIVGARRFDGGESDEGAAFVFLGSASGIGNGDPFTAAARFESDQAGAWMGASVAGAGDVDGDGYDDVIVGATFYDDGQTDEGAAFVFTGSATGIADGIPFTAAAQLESNQPNAGFGLSVSGAGDTNGDGYGDVIVGAIVYDNGQTDEGAAFVFPGSPSGVASSNPGTPGVTQVESNQASAGFGFSVAGAGDVNGDGYADAIVGAYAYDAGQGDEGAAFVFPGGASGIASSHPATPGVAQLESNQAGAFLGYSVAGAGDTNGDGYADVIVGTVFYDNGETNEGAAFVFLGSASGIASSNPATSGVAQLEANQANATLGNSVAGAGDVNGDGYADAIVGANGYDGGHSNEGAAFVFVGSASGIVDGDPATALAQIESSQAEANLGFSVAGAGDVNGDGYADVIAGVYRYDNGETDEGAAFVSLGGPAGIAFGNPATAAAQLEPEQASAQLGVSVAGAGDVNGDGYGDVIVGARLYDAGQSSEGAAFVFIGSSSGIADSNPATAATQLEGDQPDAQLGGSVASAGDVNGDGYADVIVGASLYDAPESAEGAAFVFLGSATGIAAGNPATAAAQLESNQPLATLGGSVAAAGDVNGDGYGDVIVGANLYDAPESAEGAAFVFLGSATGIADGNPVTAAAQLESNQPGANLGASVAGAGDVNGDGYADLIAGAYTYSNGPTPREGAAFVFLGSATGIAAGNPATAAAQLEADQMDAQLGVSVASAGDVNGDGYADVIVGANFYDLPEDGEGAAFVFLGSATGIADGNPATAAAHLQVNLYAQLGTSVAGAGDLNGDGYADVIVGAPAYDAAQTGGAAFVFLGSATGLGTEPFGLPSAALLSDQASSRLGSSVAGAGDVNGDGYADVIVGAFEYDAGLTDEGAAFLFLGNANTKGRPVLARQRRGNGSGIVVQPWGRSRSATGFAAELRASHPQGTGRVKAELEACPSDGAPAVPFGDASCTTAFTPSWVTVNGTTPEVLLSHTFTGLVNNTLYRWRARVLHAPAVGTVPANPEHGPWRRLGAQSVEGDIRLPEPGLLVPLISGLALVASLARRRR